MKTMVYAGLAGDRNDRGMRGAAALGLAIAGAVGLREHRLAAPAPLVEGGWAEQLAAARPTLGRLATAVADEIRAGRRPLLTLSRCAASLATLPIVARAFPDAAILWFDAHGDCNVPDEERARYLGGMVLTGAAGEWRTGLGAGLDLANVILVGARDLDPPERARVASGAIRLVPVGPDLPARLKAAVAGRPVYIHLDCDVLSAGLVATEYQSPDGLSFADLARAFSALASADLIGLEIAEFEERWPDGRSSPPDDLIAAIQPAIEALKRERGPALGSASPPI